MFTKCVHTAVLILPLALAATGSTSCATAAEQADVSAGATAEELLKTLGMGPIAAKATAKGRDETSEEGTKGTTSAAQHPLEMSRKPGEQVRESNDTRSQADNEALLSSATEHRDRAALLAQVLTYQKQRLACLREQKENAQRRLEESRSEYAKREVSLRQGPDSASRRSTIVELETESRSLEAALSAVIVFLTERISRLEKETAVSQEQAVQSNAQSAPAYTTGPRRFQRLLDERTSESQQYFDSLKALVTPSVEGGGQ